jgi:SAM-dependent methyltransferase
MRDALRAFLLQIPIASWFIRQRRRLVKLRRFRRQFDEFSQLHDSRRLALRWEDRHPCLDDATAGVDFDTHYVFHTAWAARCVARNRPERHVDISSSLYFSALVSAFVPVSSYDYRTMNLGLSGLECGQANLLALPFADRSIASLSCLHVIEHIGLGRYGEPLDPEGDLRALRELERVLAPGGSLLIAVPVGRSRIAFNAHRIYSHSQIVAALPTLRLEEFALVPDAPRAELILDAAPSLADAQHYGCGCFRFTRPA